MDEEHIWPDDSHNVENSIETYTILENTKITMSRVNIMLGSTKLTQLLLVGTQRTRPN